MLSALAALPGMGGLCLPGPVWARAFAELRLAEAAARRALFVMAADVPSPSHAEPTGLPPEAAPAPGPAPALSPTSRSPLPPVFNLSDPLPDPMALAGLAEAPGPAGPIVASGAARPSAGLKARMAALQAVLDDPGPALARFLRRRDRRRRHIFDPGTAPRLRPGSPPGFDVRRALEWAMDALMEIHTLAMAGSRAPPA
ncbi:MAG: hypothetical protein AAFQ22_02430 [Pseudomonadota bacterium]